MSILSVGCIWLNPHSVTQHSTHSPCELSSGPCPKASLPLSLSPSLCLADIKLLGTGAASPLWEVSAGRIPNIWTARSASNNAAFVPLPYSLLTSQLWKPTGQAAGSCTGGRGTAGQQEASGQGLHVTAVCKTSSGVESHSLVWAFIEAKWFLQQQL